MQDEGKRYQRCLFSLALHCHAINNNSKAEVLHIYANLGCSHTICHSPWTLKNLSGQSEPEYDQLAIRVSF